MTEKNNIPKGYKDSAVGIIPQNWEVKTLNECFQISAGRDLQKEYFSKTSTNTHCYPIFSNSLDNKGLYGYTSHPRYKAGSITITGRGMLGVAEYRKIDFDAIVRLLVLFPKLNITGQLITEYINFKKPFYFECTGVPQLTAPQIANIQIPIPPLEEQKKIAEILSTWDEAIEKQSKLIEKLELRKQGIMQRLLTGRTRLPGFTTPWQKVKLGDIFTERNETKCEHLALLSITADKGVILQSESDKKDTSNEDKSKYKRICPNDIGYNTMRMWQGRSALSNIEGIVSPAYTIVTPKKNINTLFISEVIKLPRVIYDFWTHSQGLVGDTLNCKFHDFKQITVLIPSIIEQNTISKILTTIDEEINIQRKKLKTFRTQKRGLMQQLLTGKTRVKI